MRFWVELRQSLAALRRAPGFLALGLLTMALGVGANLAVLSVLEGVVLRPLPLPEPERLVMAWETQEGERERLVAPANFLDWRSSARSFTGLAAMRAHSASLTGDGPAEALATYSVSGNFFEVLGVVPAAGRLFASAHDSDGVEHRVAVLSYGFWQQRYAGADSALGRSLVLDGVGYEIVGVLPAGFEFPRRADLFTVGRGGVPLGAPVPGDVTKVRDAHYLRVVGRLRPGVSLEAARAELAGIAGELAAAYPETNAGLGAWVQPAREWLVGPLGSTLWLLQAGAGLLAVAAFANLANLLLARGLARARALAVRRALGATPWTVARLALAESVILAAGGSVLALVVALAGRRVLLGLVADPAASPPALPDGWLVAAALAATVMVAGALVGALPALAAARQAPGAALHGGERSGSGPATRRTQRVLVVAQLAVAQALLAGLLLLLGSFQRLTAVPHGFEPAGILALELRMPAARVEDAASKQRFLQAVLDNLRSISGVESAEMAMNLPGSGLVNRGFWLEGRPRRGPNEVETVGFQTVSPGYFETLRWPLGEGRAFDDGDRADSAPVAIVNRRLAQRYWPHESPLGNRLGFGEEGDPAQLRTVVGVVADAHEDELASAVEPAVYIPFRQDRESWSAAGFVVRSRDGIAPASLAEPARAAVLAADPGQPVRRALPLTELLAGEHARRRVTLGLVAAFAVVALSLAAVGTFAVLALSVATRTREIGVRMALGADARAVLRGVVAGGARLAAAGCVTGLALALSLSRWLQAQLYGTQPWDPVLLGSAALLVGGAALLASMLPAVRAARVEPARALRAE